MFRKKRKPDAAAADKEVEKIKQDMRREVKKRMAPVIDLNRLYEQNGISLRIYVATHGGRR